MAMEYCMCRVEGGVCGVRRDGGHGDGCQAHGSFRATKRVTVPPRRRPALELTKIWPASASSSVCTAFYTEMASLPRFTLLSCLIVFFLALSFRIHTPNNNNNMSLKRINKGKLDLIVRWRIYPTLCVFFARGSFSHDFLMPLFALDACLSRL